ncbi:MAG: choice-of-anchor J domain-containing protein [Prevotella sp.]|nr:choice-of-anchor J domain-containing protein [Prevotella sp.]
MKKLSLLLASAVLAFSSQAAVTTPQFYSEDFVEMAREGDAPTDGWLTYGIDAQPYETFKNFFGSVDSNYVLLQYGSTICVVSCAHFADGETADQWLVSPEIEITEDNVALGFTTCVYNNYRSFGIASVPYRILVSENGGSAKADFSETPVFSANMVPNANNEITMKNLVVPLNGYKGKKIRLAFVQTGADSGPVGFTNINLGAYYCKIQNYTELTANKDQSITFDINCQIKTPVECAGLNATLFVNGEKVTEKYVKKTLGPTKTGTIQPTRVTFSDAYTMTDKSLNFTIEVTPAYEGAPTSSYTGVVGLPITEYINNTVVEEITATGCQACPAGIASMEYMADNFKGTQYEGKFIGIALHGYIDHNDPMSEGIDAYRTTLQSQVIGNTTYPAAAFNRALSGSDPWDIGTARGQVTSKSMNKAVITNLHFPTDVTDDILGKQVTVDFDVYNAYDAIALDLATSVVMIENDVRGYNSDYNQTNGFYNRTASYITNSYNALIVPYMQKYLAGGEFGKEIIPYEQMVYNHVGRGVFPDFYGNTIEGAWEGDKARNLSISFKVPETIMEWKNTEVIVLVTDKNSNKIVASDIVPVTNFKPGDSAVESVFDNVANIVANGSEIIVNANAGSVINVYSVDGTVVYSAKATTDSTVIDASALQGIVIVTVDGQAKKLVF